jgi:hypothetical protein
MKKSKTKGQEQNRKPRRLNLSRETIRLLNKPELLGLARGGETGGHSCACNTISDVDPSCDLTCGHRPTGGTTTAGTTTGTEAP